MVGISKESHDSTPGRVSVIYAAAKSRDKTHSTSLAVLPLLLQGPSEPSLTA